MGCLGSVVPKIDAIRFSPFPANKVVTGLTKLVCIGHCTYGLGAKGTVYTNGELAGKVCYTGTGENYHAVKALRLLGLISAEEAKKHGELKARQDLNLERYRAATAEIECLTEAGIKLTRGQKAKMAEMGKLVDVKYLPYWLGKKTAEEKLGRV